MAFKASTSANITNAGRAKRQNLDFLFAIGNVMNSSEYETQQPANPGALITYCFRLTTSGVREAIPLLKSFILPARLPCVTTADCEGGIPQGEIESGT